MYPQDTPIVLSYPLAKCLHREILDRVNISFKSVQEVKGYPNLSTEGLDKLSVGLMKVHALLAELDRLAGLAPAAKALINKHTKEEGWSQLIRYITAKMLYKDTSRDAKVFTYMPMYIQRLQRVVWLLATPELGIIDSEWRAKTFTKPGIPQSPKCPPLDQAADEFINALERDKITFKDIKNYIID